MLVAITCLLVVRKQINTKDKCNGTIRSKSRSCHLHRARQEEDRHRHGCGLRSETPGPYPVRIRRLDSATTPFNLPFGILKQTVLFRTTHYFPYEKCEICGSYYFAKHSLPNNLVAYNLVLQSRPITIIIFISTIIPN